MKTQIKIALGLTRLIYEYIFSCRFLFGVADAAALTSLQSILMVYYPNKFSSVVSWIEMFYGLGYIIGNIMAMFTFLSTNTDKISRTKN